MKSKRARRVAATAVAGPPPTGGATRTAATLEKARAYKGEIAAKLFGVRALAVPGEPGVKIPEKSNIVGIGFGAKATNGSTTDGLAVRVYVRTKLPKSQLAGAELVPPAVNDLPTDLIAVGDIRVNPADVLPEILTIGPVVLPDMPASLYQSVRKHGRTTLHTIGVIMDISADINVLYGSNTAHFEDQLAIVGAGSSFSSGGDSGSLVVDGVTRRPVGLLFAGGGSMTFTNPIDQVISRLRIQIV